MNNEVYDADYFMRGKQSGKSLYENYRYLPAMTIPMVQRIIDHCGILKTDRVLDFGCARGFTVKAFRDLGYESYGIDVSKWAIENADPDIAKYLTLSDDGVVKKGYQWIIAKDVLEHVPNLQSAINNLLECALTGVFVVVPLSDNDGDPYVAPEYEKDITHLHRLTLSSWARMFVRPGWAVESRFHVHGIKQNYAEWATGNGFLTARRVKWL